MQFNKNDIIDITNQTNKSIVDANLKQVSEKKIHYDSNEIKSILLEN